MKHKYKQTPAILSVD